MARDNHATQSAHDLSNKLGTGARLRTQTQPDSNANQNSRFLSLPLDVILNIADQLPPHAELVLSTTCRAMHSCVRHRHRPSALGLIDREEHIQYLACMARDMPDHWVCHHCLDIHCLQWTDSPLVSSLRFNYCHQNLPKRLQAGMLENWQVYSLFHRHVQVALKYTRLGNHRTPAQDDRLRRLMAPVHNHIGPQRGPVKNVEFSVSGYPRIAAGKYVLYSSYRCGVKNGLARELSMRAIQELDICPHQEWLMLRLRQSTSDVLQSYPNVDSTDTCFSQAVQLALNRDPGSAVSGSCPWCTTDYSVEVCFEHGRKFVHVQTWQDLGTEGAPNSLPWAAVARHETELGNPATAPTCQAAPGSSRALFELADDCERQQGKTQLVNKQSYQTERASRKSTWRRLRRWIQDRAKAVWQH